MAVQWSDYREQLRRSVLQDENADPTKRKWSDPALADLCGWALDTFCAHTAKPTTVTFKDGDTKNGGSGATYDLRSDTKFYLPDDRFEKVDISGQVYYVDGSQTVFLDPIRYTEVLNRHSEGFCTYPTGVLNLSSAIGSGRVLYVDYFAYWPRPVNDTDTIDIPRWATMALSFLIGVYALTGYGMREADISQWKTRRESGNPEDSSLRSQQEWLLKMYERELARVLPQDRTNYFREARL